MTCPILITVSGYTMEGDGADDSPIRLTTRGTLNKDDAGTVIEYDESQTDENTGAIQTQHITLLVKPNRVEMTRSGDYGTTMVFMKDRHFEGAYRTPYGELSLSVMATRVSVKQGSIHLQYQLSVQGQYSGMHDLKLDYHPLENQA